MMTLSLAIRNLLRNRRRSLATLLAMAIGSTAILLFGGFKTSISYGMQTTLIRQTGHLQVQHRDFFLYGSGDPTAYGISDYAALIEAIKKDEVLKDMVLVASPTLQFGGIAGNYAASVSRTVIGKGYVAEDANRMRRWDGFGTQSTMMMSTLEGAPNDSAVVGVGVARVLQLCSSLAIANCPKPMPTPQTEGDALPDDIAQLSLQEGSAPTAAVVGRKPKIEVLVVNARGAPNVTSLQVIQAEDQGIKELDEVAIIMHLSTLQKLVYGNSQPKVTSVLIQLRDSQQIGMARTRLATILSKFSGKQPLAVLDYRELSPFFVQTMQMFNMLFSFVFLLIGSIVLFTVSNTMNTTVSERTVEIGTLRAIGLRRLGILKLFVVEGALLGVFGALLGALLALSVAGVINQIGMEWLPPATAAPIPFTVAVWGETRMIFGTTLGLIVVAVASAWWPAYRAAHLHVVDALRHV